MAAFHPSLTAGFRPIADIAASDHNHPVRYQDLKVRDAGRLAAIALIMATVAGLSIAFRETAERVVNLLPMRSPEAFVPVVSVIAVAAAASAVMTVYYLWTSPAQNLQHIRRMGSRRGDSGGRFDASLFDPSDPDFSVRTWDYLKRRLRR